MSGEEITTIVDKLAEKLNVAVEQVRPLAEETIRQYVEREIFLARCCWISVGLGALLAIVAVMMAIWLYKKDANEPLWMAPIGACCVVNILLWGNGIQGLIAHYANAIAPYASLLGL